MKLAQIALTALVSAAIAFGVGKYTAAPSVQAEAKKETAFERVMRTRTLRCAYVVRPPHLMVDPNTKQISGIDHDIIEEIGKAAGLKIEWQDEVGYGNYPEHLNTNKQDALCTIAMISARRAQRVELTLPVTFMPVYVYGREGDARFDNDTSTIDKKSTVIAVVDGSIMKAATDAAFPNASQFAIPGEADIAQSLLAVATKKADLVLTDDNMMFDFNTHNPDNKLRRVPSYKPVRISPEAFSVAKGETELRDFLNASLLELVGNGFIEKIIARHTITPDAVLQMAPTHATVPVQRAERTSP